MPSRSICARETSVARVSGEYADEERAIVFVSIINGGEWRVERERLRLDNGYDGDFECGSSDVFPWQGR